MKNNYRRKRLFFIAIIVAISALALIFIVINFRNNIVFFYSPSELDKVLRKNRAIRVGGMVKENSVKKIDALNFEFLITDYAKDLKIRYHGILPDLFREKQGVVAKGFLNENKTEFSSEELLIKHDENYMPPEVANSIKNKNGQEKY